MVGEESLKSGRLRLPSTKKAGSRGFPREWSRCTKRNGPLAGARGPFQPFPWFNQEPAFLVNEPYHCLGKKQAVGVGNFENVGAMDCSLG